MIEPLFHQETHVTPCSEFIADISRGHSVTASGVTAGGMAYLCARMRRSLGRPLLCITGDSGAASTLHSDLETVDGETLFEFPLREALPKDIDPDVTAARFTLLRHLVEAGGKADSDTALPLLVVAPLRVLAHFIPAPEQFSSRIIRIARGETLSREAFLGECERNGYRRVGMVEEKGEYRARGGIIDIFPVEEDHPFRIEFFSDKIDTIRTFDPGTQRSLSKEVNLAITPVNEHVLDGDFHHTLLEYLPDTTLPVIIEPNASFHTLEGACREGSLSRSPHDVIRELCNKQRVYLSLLPEEVPQCPAERNHRLDFSSLDAYRSLALAGETGQAGQKEMLEHIRKWLRKGMRIVVFCNNAGEVQRLRELLRGEKIEFSGESVILVGRFSAGVISPGENLVVVTDNEIFARYKRTRPRRRFKGTGGVREFTRFTRGELVVHVRHGIGRYRGIVMLEREGGEDECLAIEYRDRAKLYVPMAQACLVERYVGVTHAPVQLDRLGGARWKMVRASAQRAIYDYAAELLRIHAVRHSGKGYAAAPDTPWQREFEDAFIYEETPDQATAIDAVKRDMEGPYPMDRLICGDVGYGKTEVAMRAAFKAVVENKQVAVLVPTTILAQQHFITFTERFADYPVAIEMLSRFRSPAAQRRILESLRKGTIDIVIGTHRLVQKDVFFRDLGLVVIDEEQRFGVKHKEHLKRMRATVDILTMTATPIPRTLYISLSGIRDMSTIQTPPADRLSIETSIHEYDEELIRAALRRELKRGGQAYVVHNRVETIKGMKELIETLAPGARVAIGHGQMSADELEEVMKNFIDGRIDILVCTTIIEAGLDIPNVNTIIVDRADRFGLADLYQLRGRVGRYRQRAYALFLYPKGKPLFDDARKRLRAIMEHTSLGSGFKIALRDLEIRGAGNILGVEQHGHVAAIGFDLYCKLLRRAVAALKGEEERGIEEIRLKLPWQGALSAAYIPSEEQRIDLYKRLGEITADRDLNDIAEELSDRFGPLPGESILLLELFRLKLLMRDAGIDSLRLHGDKIIAEGAGREVRVAGRYPRVTASTPLAGIQQIAGVLRNYIENSIL